MRLYCVLDRVAEESSPPFAAVNDGVAIREYRALLQQVAHVDKEAYRLYWVGECDTETMAVTGRDCPAEIVMEVIQYNLLKEGRDA
nr:MAG: nonstructural protein [Microvirus sp.]